MAGRGAERRVLEGRDGFDEVGSTPQMHRRRGAEPRMQHLTYLSARRRVPSEVAHSNGSLPTRAPVPSCRSLTATLLPLPLLEAPRFLLLTQAFLPLAVLPHR